MRTKATEKALPGTSALDVMKLLDRLYAAGALLSSFASEEHQNVLIGGRIVKVCDRVLAHNVMTLIEQAQEKAQDIFSQAMMGAADITEQ